jgi:hypothetical protein
VTSRSQPPEYFTEMKLGAAGLRIFVVLPVQNEDPH